MIEGGESDSISASMGGTATSGISDEERMPGTVELKGREEVAVQQQPTKKTVKYEGIIV